LDIEVTGSIRFTSVPSRSILSLSGQLKPHPEFIKELGKSFPVNMFFKKKSKTNSFPFTIKGTIDKTRFSMQ